MKLRKYSLAIQWFYGGSATTSEMEVVVGPGEKFQSVEDAVHLGFKSGFGVPHDGHVRFINPQRLICVDATLVGEEEVETYKQGR